jgi:ankyrin repeat protein
MVSKRSGDGVDTSYAVASALREVISHSLERALCQIHQPCCTSNTNHLREMISSSIIFPNKSTPSCENGEMDLSGKPYDIEVRVVLQLYHQWRRQQQQQQQKASVADPTTVDRSGTIEHSSNGSVSSITLMSDLGLSREISSPQQLAELLSPLLEDEIGDNLHWGLTPDVRCQASGVLSLITWERSQALRETLGMLPCPHCISWCKGEKGLWWHQQLYHQQVHEQATAVAQATSNKELAIVVYNSFANDDRSTPSNEDWNSNIPRRPKQEVTTTDPFKCIQEGNLTRLQYLVDHGNLQQQLATVMDRNGATPLMWAAGGGHLTMVRYLIDHCHCDPMTPQRGKRSFSGRTALHWAARNGKLPVVQYLLTWAADTSSLTSSSSSSPSRKTQMLEATTRDGTTAFGWACWQRHLDVMVYLHQEGCMVDGVNCFGCSPVLWCSQGCTGDGLAALQWLQACGCDMHRVNNNGHSVLHKAAQRGQHTVAEWFVQDCIKKERDWKANDAVLPLTNIEDSMLVALVGPDVEGYCPSDLAGLEGYNDLAIFLAKIEMEICRHIRQIPSCNELPEGYGGYSRGINNDVTKSNEKEYVWEKYGGLRRIMSCWNKPEPLSV